MDKKQYLYRIQPTRPAMLSEGPTAAEQTATAAHFAYVQGLLKDGVLILAGRTQNTDDTSFGIVIFEAESDAAAKAIMDNDPAVQAGVMRAALFPYRVALMQGRD